MPSARFGLVTLLLAALALGLGVPSVMAEEPAPESRNFAERMLDRLALGEPIVTNQLVMFPLVIEPAPEDLPIDGLPDTDEVDFEEPEFPSRRYDVLARNTGKRPVLVLGGTVLEGGLRDRLIRRSAIIGPGTEVEMTALPAATTSDIRKEAEPFGIGEALAPKYLRKRAEFGGSASTVNTFIARWLEFREEGDDRKSLVAIAESSKLKSFCLPCHQSMAAFPQPKEAGPRVIGGISVVHGRIQSLTVFGDNRLLRSFFEMLIKGATYPAAAIELRAKPVGIKLPGRQDPEATTEILRKEAQELLEKLRKARYKKDRGEEGEVGEAWWLRTSDGTRGRALGLDGRLVHLAVYPHDPFETALYGTALDVPEGGSATTPEGEDDREGIAELVRRAGRGFRLTEAEKRLLERLRPRSGPVPRAPGPPGPRPPPRR